MEHQQVRSSQTLLNPSNVFVTSDFHFDHDNIRRYCSRPFTSIEEMNKTLFYNYWSTVQNGSTIIFLGDMSFGRNSHNARYWLDAISYLPLPIVRNSHVVPPKHVSSVIYLKGSHDQGVRPTNTFNCYDIATIQNIELRCNIHFIHDPCCTPPELTHDWVVHGHKHNNSPFFDRARKRINCSVEVTDYKPVCLQFLYQLIDDESVKHIDTIPAFIQKNNQTFKTFQKTIPNLM